MSVFVRAVGVCVCASCVQSELVQRAEQIGVQERQLEEDHHSELLDAVQHAREREMEKRGKQQQLEEKL